VEATVLAAFLRTLVTVNIAGEGRYESVSPLEPGAGGGVVELIEANDEERRVFHDELLLGEGDVRESGACSAATHEAARREDVRGLTPSIATSGCQLRQNGVAERAGGKSTATPRVLAELAPRILAFSVDPTC
jgi:hypothetical protein